MRSCLWIALFLAACAGLANAQSVVINKYQNTSALDTVELLVIQDHLDMRGMILKDYSSSGANDNGGSYTFSTNALWADVRKGTLIDLPSDSSEADTSATDYVLNIGLKNTTYFAAGSGTYNISNGEFVEIKSAGSAASGTTGHIHGLGDCGASATQFAAAPSPKLRSTTTGSSSFVYATNPTQSLADFDGENAATVSSGITFGQGNNAANTAYITSLRGVAADDPNILLNDTVLMLNASSTTATVSVPLAIQNTGSAQNLNVTAANFSGAGAAKFSVGTLPTGIAPNGTQNLTIIFNPQGVEGITSATLTIASNDQSGNTPTVTVWGAAANNAKYAGLYITEVASQPDEDEFIEVKNTSASAIDISGVIVSDEDNNNTEGSAVFPAGTSIASGEVIMISVGNASATAPGWLASLPSGTRIFLDPSRNASGWSLPSGVTATAMTQGSTSSNIALSSGDGCALYAPGVSFVSGIGPLPTTGCIDGMNYPAGDTGPSCPINSTGQLDTLDSKANAAQPASGNGLTRINKGANTASNLFYAEQAITPGVSALAVDAPAVNAAHDWEMFE